MLPAPIELVKLQLHGDCSLASRSVWSRLELVFFGRRGKCAGNSRGINEIRAELVFRGAHQECSHNPNEISAFLPELVFREIPGKLAQRRRQTQWFRRLFLRSPLLNAVAGSVLRILRTPVRLRLLAPRRLALRTYCTRVGVVLLARWDGTTGGRWSTVFSGARAS